MQGHFLPTLKDPWESQQDELLLNVTHRNAKQEKTQTAPRGSMFLWSLVLVSCFVSFVSLCFTIPPHTQSSVKVVIAGEAYRKHSRGLNGGPSTLPCFTSRQGPVWGHFHLHSQNSWHHYWSSPILHSWPILGRRVYVSQMWQRQPVLSPSPGALAGSMAHSDSNSSLAASTTSLQVRQTWFKSQLCQ